MNKTDWTPSDEQIEAAVIQLKRKGVVFVGKKGITAWDEKMGNKSFGRMDLLKRAGFRFVKEKK